MRQDGRDDTGPIFVLGLEGELDVATAPGVIERGTAAINRGGMQVLVVDLSAVSFIDSTAVRALVGLRSDAEQVGIELRLRSVPPRARRILEITGLDQVFVIDGD